MATWHTPDTVRDEWGDAEQIGDSVLAQLVTAARDAVVAYAPALTDATQELEVIAPDDAFAVRFTRRNGWVDATVVSIEAVNLTLPAGTVPVAFRPGSVATATVDGLVLTVYPDGALWLIAEHGGEIRLYFGVTTDPDSTFQSIPDRYRLAQLMQVRNLWSAVDVKPDGNQGGENFVYQPYPLDWHVKALLRPTSGVPKVG